MMMMIMFDNNETLMIGIDRQIRNTFQFMCLKLESFIFFLGSINRSIGSFFVFFFDLILFIFNETLFVDMIVYMHYMYVWSLMMENKKKWYSKCISNQNDHLNNQPSMAKMIIILIIKKKIRIKSSSSWLLLLGLLLLADIVFGQINTIITYIYIRYLRNVKTIFFFFLNIV